jgi:hypothetical protein
MSQDLGYVVTAERPSSREHFVEHRTERPQIRASIDGTALCLFRTHVGRRPEDHANVCRMQADRWRIHRIRPRAP